MWESWIFTVHFVKIWGWTQSNSLNSRFLFLLPAVLIRNLLMSSQGFISFIKNLCPPAAASLCRLVQLQVLDKVRLTHTVIKACVFNGGCLTFLYLNCSLPHSVLIKQSSLSVFAHVEPCFFPLMYVNVWTKY